MKPFEEVKDNLIRAQLWLLMLLALVASMRHVAWLFSTIEMMNYASGWIAAVGFDFGIFLLTLIAHKYKEGSAQRRFIRLGIYSNAFLSAVANVMYGVEHQVQLQRVNGWLWILIPYVFALALPMMVVFLAEVLSREEENESRSFEREQRREERKANKATELHLVKNGQELVNDGQINRTDRLTKVVEAVSNNCKTRSEIVRYSGIPKGSVSNLLSELYATNRLVKNESNQPELPNLTSDLTNGLTSGVQL